jgi:hypothetical protein
MTICTTSHSLWVTHLLLAPLMCPLHVPPPDINEWHQQAYGVPFMSPVDDEVEEYFLADDVDQFAPSPYQGDPGPSSYYPPPQDPSDNTPPPANPGEENFVVNLWLLASLIPLHRGNMWSSFLLFLVLPAKKGEKFVV